MVEKYPKSEVSEMAGMIVKGVQEGRRLHGGKFDLGDVWSRRDITQAATDSAATDTLSTERNTEFLYILAYEPDSLNENQLLFEMARYNFTNFMVRNFDLQIERDNRIHRMLISGFLSYDEALQYARKLHSAQELSVLLRHCRTLIISQQNLALVGTRFSYDEYDQFYQDTFQPMEISNEQLLILPETPPTPIDPEDEPADEEYDDEEEEAAPDDDLDFGEDFF